MPGKLLVLTHEFPPTGGAGVQRVLKFCRYLPEFGWEPLVVTGSTGYSRPVDTALLQEVSDTSVVRTAPNNLAWSLAEVFARLKRTRGVSDGAADAGSPVTVSGGGVPLSTRVASWVTVPDPAAPWIRGGVRAALELGRRAGATAVFATVPPYSVGVAGERVARTLGLPLIVDLRDAWAGNVSHRYPTQWHRNRSLSFERRVMSASALVTAAAETAADEAREYGAGRAEVVYNGFDIEVPRRVASSGGPLRVVFLGRFFAATDPAPFLQGLADAVSAGADIVFDVVGPVYPRGIALATQLGIADRVTWHGFVPRAEALRLASTADIGLVVLAHSAEDLSWYPLKAFEYLGMRLPVLIVGPEQGVASRLVERASAGWTVAPEAAMISARLLALAASKAAGPIVLDSDDALIDSFSRRSQAGQLAGMLDQVVAEKGGRP